VTDEPYRWLEAIANRREYIRDQLKGATPVFALSRPEGVLLLGVGTGQSKVFEIYDRHALAALGHPVDIEKMRQALIEAAHLEGFTRAPEDVTVRRLLNFALGPALKSAFEQIFSAPIIMECLLVEAGSSPGKDTLARVSFDGTHRLESDGVAVAHVDPGAEPAARNWLRTHLTPDLTIGETARRALSAWRVLSEGRSDYPEAGVAAGPLSVDGRTVELALVERQGGRVRYRALDSDTLL